jgi:alcohol dehydrogenase
VTAMQSQHLDRLQEVRTRDPLRPARYELPTSIIYGSEALARLPELLAEAGVSHPLIVTDRGLTATPVPQLVVQVLTLAGIRHAVFSEIEPDPSTAVVDAVARLLLEHGHDGVIGLGGGSAMDAAKAAAAAATSGIPVSEMVGPDAVTADPLPIIAIPTTAGTGSEVTRFAVLSDHQAGSKVSMNSIRIMPKFAVLDPALTVSLPPGLTASTGIDALAHAIESYGSVWNNPVSEGMALHSIALVGQHLRVATRDPGNLVARAGMLAASCIAELAANTTRLGLAHALAVPLGATHHIPHGVAVAMMLEPMCAFNEQVEPQRYERVAAALNGSSTALSRVIHALCEDVGLNSRLRDFGVVPDDYDRIVALAMKSDNVLANPRPAGNTELRQLLESAR